MKTISSTEMQTRLDDVLSSAQNERIVLTRRGRPSAVLIGIESYDDEDLQLARSEEFWRLIEERRRGPSISLAELKSRLTTKKPARSKPSPPKPALARSKGSGVKAARKK